MAHLHNLRQYMEALIHCGELIQNCANQTRWKHYHHH